MQTKFSHPGQSWVGWLLPRAVTQKMASPASLGRPLLCEKASPRCLWTPMEHQKSGTACKHFRGKFSQGQGRRKGPFIEQSLSGLLSLLRECNLLSFTLSSLDEYPNYCSTCYHQLHWVEEIRLSQLSWGSVSPRRTAQLCHQLRAWGTHTVLKETHDDLKTESISSGTAQL